MHLRTLPRRHSMTRLLVASSTHDLPRSEDSIPMVFECTRQRLLRGNPVLCSSRKHIFLVDGRLQNCRVSRVGVLRCTLFSSFVVQQPCRGSPHTSASLGCGGPASSKVKNPGFRALRPGHVVSCPHLPRDTPIELVEIAVSAVAARLLTEEQWPCDDYDFYDTLVSDKQHGDAGIPRDSFDSRADCLPVVTGHGVEGRDYRPSNFSSLFGALGSQDIDIGYYHVNVSAPIGALATPTPDMVGSGADSGMKLESPSSVTAAEGDIDGQYAFGVASSSKKLDYTSPPGAIKFAATPTEAQNAQYQEEVYSQQEEMTFVFTPGYKGPDAIQGTAAEGDVAPAANDEDGAGCQLDAACIHHFGHRTSISDVQAHLDQRHGGVLHMAPAGGKISCLWREANGLECRKRISLGGFAKHVATTHLKRFAAPCPHCNRMLSRADSLARHIWKLHPGAT